MQIRKYSSVDEKSWDDFVTEESVNGTFLQTRNFLNYHPMERFDDCSLIVEDKGKILAVIPSCSIIECNKKIFSSHKGSTFGGLVIRKGYNNLNHIFGILDLFDEFLKENNFNQVVLKITPDIFSKESSDLLQYALFSKDYKNYKELGTYIDLNNYAEDILSEFNTNQKRNYKSSLKNKLKFLEINNRRDIINFYKILEMNLEKFCVKPVHTIDELINLKENILKENLHFYANYYNDEMIAGTMVFWFEKMVFHTQYLAAHPNYLGLHAMNNLYYNLIETARNEKFSKLSWGISTERQGRILNYNLASFKESFGSKFSINRSFYKEL